MRLTSFGISVTAGSGADGNTDGVVDAADYVVWREAISAASVSVPEPTTLLTAVIACLLCSRRLND